MKTVSRDWLAERKACGDDLTAAVREFGGDIELSRTNFERALALGVNLLWLGCNLVDGKTLSEFVAFTLQQREPALAVLTSAPLPEGPLEQRLRAVEAWRRWGADADLGARSEAIALREAARDMTRAATVSPAEAEEAALAALRAVSFAFGDSGAARREQLDWLAERTLEK